MSLTRFSVCLTDNFLLIIFSANNKNSFSIIEIWNQLIDENKLYGFESLNDFIHVTDIEIFNKLSKNY